MAWIQERERADGGVSARVEWRLGGGRKGPRQEETFSAGSEARGRARCGDGERGRVGRTAPGTSSGVMAGAFTETTAARQDCAASGGRVPSGTSTSDVAGMRRNCVRGGT